MGGIALSPRGPAQLWVGQGSESARRSSVCRNPGWSANNSWVPFRAHLCGFRFYALFTFQGHLHKSRRPRHEALRAQTRDLVLTEMLMEWMTMAVHEFIRIDCGSGVGARGE